MNDFPHIVYSGLTDYGKALKIMDTLQGKILESGDKGILLLMEHPHTYTAGTSAKDQDLLQGSKSSKVATYYTGRGGQWTYHGPGQRIIYPIINLAHYKRDLHWYVGALEQLIINVLGALGIEGARAPDGRGVWAKMPQGSQAKIASIGIRVRKWITSHGIALNVDTDLDYFRGIVPCGIQECLFGRIKDFCPQIDMHELDLLIVKHFSSLLKIA